MKLNKGETIVTAYAEHASGPGWSNVPIWVIIRTQGHSLRIECVQPEDQTPTMIALYKVSEAAHLSMTQAVKILSAKYHKKTYLK